MNTSAYHLYVQVNGDDAHADGTPQNPFATLQKAKEYVKTLDKSKGDIVVEIGDGVYELDETIVFDAQDSGTDACQIRYVAAENATPILSGGKRLLGTWQNEGNGIFSIELHRDKKLRSLYVNGKRCYMTSKVVKGKGATGKYSLKAGSADWAWVSGTRKSGTKFSNKDLPADTRNADDIELMTQTTWNTTIVCVESLEKKWRNTIAHLQMPYGAMAQTLGWGNAYQFKNNNMVWNVFEWLNGAGEFYFDKTAHRLYYYPREDEDLTTANVVVSELEKLVEIAGADTSNRVHNLSFEGLTLAYTDWNLFTVGTSHGRATNQGAAALIAYADEDWHTDVYRSYDLGPSAVYVTSANDIVFQKNVICHTGNDGLSLVNDVQNVIVNGNVLYDTAGAAMVIGHPQHTYIGDKNSNKGRNSDKEKYDADVEGLCKNIQITNNLFKNTCRLFWGNAGVMSYAADGLTFQYNQIENTPYSGLSLGWNWCMFNGDEKSVCPNEPTVTNRNYTVKNNKFLHCITTLGDGGAVYSIGAMPNTVISENYICKIGTEGVKPTYHIRGIHPDEGTAGVYGEKNVIDIHPEFVCIDCGDWGKKGGNVWDNNYSTSALYANLKNLEPGTRITNAHTITDGNWDETAKSVMENAGIRAEYLNNMPAEIVNENSKSIASIPTYKRKIR
ncbi:MAG: right-handed parallel beta-helix repeat-containing protein [Candidatus Fimenecus sp.]